MANNNNDNKKYSADNSAEYFRLLSATKIILYIALVLGVSGALAYYIIWFLFA